MRSVATRQFWEKFAALSRPARHGAVRAFGQFQSNPRHPSLRFKKIAGTADVYSARVTGGYRAIGVMTGDTILWNWIGSHADNDRELGF